MAVDIFFHDLSAEDYEMIKANLTVLYGSPQNPSSWVNDGHHRFIDGDFRDFAVLHPHNYRGINDTRLELSESAWDFHSEVFEVIRAQVDAGNQMQKAYKKAMRQKRA